MANKYPEKIWFSIKIEIILIIIFKAIRKYMSILIFAVHHDIIDLFILVNDIRNTEKALGNHIKTCHEEELQMKFVSSKSVAVSRDILIINFN